MEFLIVSTINALQEKGDEVLSLGLSPLANIQPEKPEEVISLEKAMELIFNRFNTVYNFKSLHHYKEKFVPQRESKYLIYPGISVLPRVIYGLIGVQIPELSFGEIVRTMNQPGNY